MPYVTLDHDMRAYYDCAGDGPALIMVHGASQDSRSWKHNVDFFAQHYRVHALDLPGHGKSDMPPGGANRNSEDNAAYLLSVIDALGLSRPVLMGHSMGGGIVAQAAATRPDAVGGLVLVDGASVNVVKSSGYNPAILEMAGINTGDWFEVTFRTLMGSQSTPACEEEIIEGARRCNPDVAYADIRAFGGFRMEQILPDIQCPTVIVQGEEDWSVPVTSAREVVTRLQARAVPVAYREWQGIGHFPQTECPQDFNRDTLAAMRELGL